MKGIKSFEPFRSVRAIKAAACYLRKHRLIGYDFYALGTKPRIMLPSLAAAIVTNYAVAVPDEATDLEIVRAFVNAPERAQDVHAEFYRRRREVTKVRRAKKSDDQTFFACASWRKLRYRVLLKQGGRCKACGRTAEDGVQIQVDHIKPRSRFPHLAMDESNLQVLCADCNIGKGWRDQTDWEKKEKQEWAR